MIDASRKGREGAMLRKLASLVAAATLALSFSAAVAPVVFAITCDDSPPYAVWYTDGSGGGNRLVQCWGDQFTSLSATFDNHISSVVVIGPNGTGKVPCAFSQTGFAGSFVKLTTGQHGFSLFQWPYTTWNGGGGADDQISSISWCNA